MIHIKTNGQCYIISVRNRYQLKLIKIIILLYSVYDMENKNKIVDIRNEVY